MKRIDVDPFDLPIHPAADVFPMLADDELDELAEDIKSNGLLQPLIVKDGVLVDGRNRREACRRAGVAPRLEELNGTDPIAYILATNVNRRHLTKGQRAMAVAKLYPDPEKGGRGKKSATQTSEKIGGFSRDYIDHARTVLRWIPELADLVMAGAKPLNDAYAEARRLKEQADAEPARLERLRGRAADLADHVQEGRIRLTEAESLYETRQEEARRQRQAITESFNGLERMLDYFADGARRANIRDHLTQTEDKTRARNLLQHWIANLSETLEALK